MSCNHATSGCEYPSGECTGACMTEQGRESQRMIRATMAGAPKRYLTIVYEIHSSGQEQALLHSAAWESVSHSNAIWQRDKLLKALDHYRAKAHGLTVQRDELVEALRSTADLLQTWIDGAPPYDEAQNDRELMANARAAIAKATAQ